MSVPGFLETLSALFAALAPLLCGLTYVLVLLCARRVWIYRRNTSHLEAYVQMVKSHLVTEQEKPQTQDKFEKAVKPEIDALLGNALSAIPDLGKKIAWRNCLSFEGVGKQLAAWRMVHDADRLTTDLWPDEHVAAHAVLVKEQLKKVGTASAATLSETIAKLIDKEDQDPCKLKALVKEARELIFDARDNHFEELADWQNRAMWLVFVATALVVLLAAVFGQTIFMLLGATGGLLARLNKAVKTKPNGFDYGVSWSMLFLAPVVGALTGWASILIADFVIALGVLNVPKSLFTTLTQDAAVKILTENTQMALALLFGFSATLFETVMSGAETAIQKKPASDNAD